MSSRSILGFSLALLGASALVACGSDGDGDTATTAASTTTATGTGGAGGATTATSTGGAGGDATGTGGAGGDATGTGGAGGGNPPPPKDPTFLFWGDYTTDATQEIGQLAFPPGTPTAVKLAGVTKLDATYDITQSPDGAHLAIAFRADGGAPKVVVTKTDGSGTPVLVADLVGQTNTPANTEVGNLIWSPDGKFLAFRADSTVNGQSLLYVAPSDGSATTPKLLTPGLGMTQEVSSVMTWVDNTHLAFGGDLLVDGVDNLFILDVTAAMPSAMPVLMQQSLSPEPAGKNVKGPVSLGADGKIYFRSSHVEAGKNLVYRCDANGANVVEVPAATVKTNNTSMSVSTFRLSRDRMSIAVAVDELGNGLQQLFVAKLTDAMPTKRTAFATAPAMGSTYGLAIGPGTIVWSPDGTQLAVVGDWPVNTATDKDNDFVAFVVPTTGNAGATRLVNVPTPAMNFDVDGVAWSHDGKRLALVADLVVNNNTELYSTADFTTADQDPMALRVVTVPTGGDISGVQAITP